MTGREAIAQAPSSLAAARRVRAGFGATDFAADGRSFGASEIAQDGAAAASGFPARVRQIAS